MKVLAVIQARMGSKRLPGKSLKAINGKPMLLYVIKRLGQCKELDKVVVATSKSSKDDAIEKFCLQHGIECFRGEEKNVLKRYFDCAAKYGFKVIVRITADCPLIDPVTVDLAVKEFLQNHADYVSNTHFRTFPRGLDVEVFSFKALEKAFREATNSAEKEHVTPYIYRNKQLFRLRSIESKGKLRRPELRLCVDTEKDFSFVERIFSQFKDLAVPIEKVIDWLDKNPGLRDASKEEEKLYRKGIEARQKFEDERLEEA